MSEVLSLSSSAGLVQTTTIVGIDASRKSPGRTTFNDHTDTVDTPAGRVTVRHHYAWAAAGASGATGAVGVKQQPVGGLISRTLYHFRFRARNAFGTGVGGDQTFTTL